MDIQSVYRLVLPHFRRRRMELFEQLFKPTATTTILDVGGYEFNWSFISARPKVTLLNVHMCKKSANGQFTNVTGDGRKLPFPDQSFDIVYSNSVIEHVPPFENQRSFANEIKRVGRKYFVETPDRTFPVEPHLMAPFIHYVPANLQRRLVRHFTLWGLIERPDQTNIDTMLSSIRLLADPEMRDLFTGARIFKERFCGFSKALIAIKDR